MFDKYELKIRNTAFKSENQWEIIFLLEENCKGVKSVKKEFYHCKSREFTLA